MAEIVWPQLLESQPDWVAPGGEIKLVGSGGYLLCGQGVYIESSRSFALSFDDQPLGSIVCYANRCETQQLAIPADTPAGDHIISVEGGSRLAIRVTR